MNKRQSFLVIAGHVVECFDVTLYGFLITQLSPLFFPSANIHLQTLVGFGTFAAGFVMRPLGALFFGYIGDRIGRKKPLLLSMALVSIPTIAIGCLPSYQNIGIAAPILLIVFRLSQGFFYGGELTGANLYMMENLQHAALGRNIGQLIAWGTLGAVLASGFSSVVNMKDVPEWAWRLLFLFGGTSAIFVYFLRKKSLDTVDFSKYQRMTQKTFPWRDLLKSHKMPLFFGFFTFGLTVMPLYLTTIFGTHLLVGQLRYQKSQAMLLTTGTMILCAAVITISGRIADKIGFYKLQIWGMGLTAVVAVPSFYLLTKAHLSLLYVLLFIGTLNAAGSIINGCISGYVGNLFPAHCRYSGLAFCITVGGAVLGGTTPSIAHFLHEIFGSLLAPGFFLMGLSLSCLLMLMYIHKISGSKNSQ